MAEQNQNVIIVLGYEMVENTTILELKDFSDEKYGSLVVVEAMRGIPFNVKRVYYIYGVPGGETRGHHSHNELEQVLICVSGSVCITVSTDDTEEDVLLDSPTKGLYIGPMVWRVMKDFSSDAVLLVLASEYFDEADYIRSYDSYAEKAKEYFKK